MHYFPCGSSKGIKARVAIFGIGLLMPIWSSARLIDSAVTITSINLGSNKFRIGDILVLVYSGCRGKWPLNKHDVVVVTVHKITSRYTGEVVGYGCTLESGHVWAWVSSSRYSDSVFLSSTAASLVLSD